MMFLSDDFATLLVLALIAAAITTGWALARRRPTLMCISLAGVVLCAAVLTFWPREPRYGSGRRSICMNNLRQIGTALMNYETSKSHFPSPFTTDEDGNPLHSWRTLLLPYIERASLFAELDLSRSWEAPRNKKFAQTEIELFHCPSDQKVGKYDTSYVAIVGRGTAWELGKRFGLSSIKDGAA